MDTLYDPVPAPPYDFSKSEQIRTESQTQTVSGAPHKGGVDGDATVTRTPYRKGILMSYFKTTCAKHSQTVNPEAKTRPDFSTLLIRFHLRDPPHRHPYFTHLSAIQVPRDIAPVIPISPTCIPSEPHITPRHNQETQYPMVIIDIK